MEAIQRQESSKRTAMVARTVASADREQEQCAPDKEQERRTGWPGSWWPSPDGRRGGRAPRREAPTGKGRGEGAERSVLGAPVDAELRKGEAPR